MNSTQHAATRLRKEHCLAVLVFRETIDVQKALTKQIVQAIEPKYLNMLRDHTHTNITAIIQKILAHLMRRYVVAGADTLSKLKQKIRDIQYNLFDLLVTMYNVVEELKQLGITAAKSYSAAQIIAFALHVIRNTRNF